MFKGLKISIWFFFIFMLLTLFSVKYSNDFNNVVYAYILEKHVRDNNLKLPFPDVDNNYYNRQKIIELFNKDINTFYNELQLNFKYERGTYDCKYWTYIWLNWWKYHSNDYKVKIINTDNHIFLILYNDKEYIIIDQDIINKRVLIN